ncbi:MAG: amidohydrolase family protein [Coriobacteriales bacterium]|nr:amidohydrolase family protein [Coriobacteriales bacterium]
MSTNLGKADVLILGNVITVDDIKPRAEAITVKDGVIQYVGSEKTARTLCDENTQVLDYDKNTVYPGFIEAHTHASFAGYRAIGQADLQSLPAGDLDAYRPVIAKFIEDNPGQEAYMAAGWGETGAPEPTHEFLDEILSDKPLLMNTSGGHSLLLNKCAMDLYGITAQRAKEEGFDLIHVDENGEPTGYVCEGVAIAIAGDFAKKVPTDECKKYILFWQDFAFENGYTGAVDAGSNIFIPTDVEALAELEQEGKLQLRIYSYVICPDNPDDPSAEVEKVKKIQLEKGGDHFVVTGVKAFLDGVMEAHTSWMVEEYKDQPGYYGNMRYNDEDKMVELISTAAKYKMPIHVHSEGSGATQFMLNCIEKSQAQTGNMDQRNALAHLHFVEEADIQKMADTNSVAITPPTWTPAIPGMYETECSYIGKELSDKSYPIKSFIDAGANMVYHSDYPVGGVLSIQENFYSAETRAMPRTPLYLAMTEGLVEGDFDFSSTARGLEEATSREESLKAQTINVAKMVHQEDKVGSLEIGKLANITVFDTDFLTCDAQDIMPAEVVATIVEGKVVYAK